MAEYTQPEMVEIREAGRSDVAAIVALLADDPLGQSREQNTIPLPPFYFRAFDAITEQHGNLLLVAELDAEIIGCLQLTMIPGLTRRGMKRAQIEGVRIAASHRSRGVGELLIRHAIDMARREECGLVQLTTDKSRPVAHRFYERLGFVATHLGMKLKLD